jgi:hypothetical protein
VGRGLPLRGNVVSAPATARRPMWRQLHVRAALVAIPLLALLGLSMYLLLRHYSAQTALEASQRMNLGLADYIVEHQPPGRRRRSGRAERARMKELALNVMMINPAVEVYLLDADGRVIAHALDGQGPDPVGRSVDMAPVRRLLEERRSGDVRLPIVGTDPRNAERLNTFSVAPARRAWATCTWS